MPEEVPHHVLWRSDDGAVTLLDGPGSIAFAQQSPKSQCQEETLSSKPQDVPFLVQEPQSAMAQKKVSQMNTNHEVHVSYRDLSDSALSEIRRHYTGPWLLPRWVPAYQADDKKRKLNDDVERHGQGESASVLNLGNNIDECLKATSGKEFRCRVAQDSSGSEDDSALLDPPFVSNLRPTSLKVEIGEESLNSFRIPPHSTFFLGDCSDPKQVLSFHASIRFQATEQDTRRHFDFILLDPPWPNRSVSRKRNAYDTPRLHDCQNMLHAMDLDRLMADDCHVAVWITNKAAVREVVLGPDGLFASWGVQLVEEWVWLKTTIQHEPVVSLDSSWRKPYEVLLLGRRRRLTASHEELIEIKRRVLVSVPDLHSRKPCLKQLIEPILLNAENYRALEVFARNLVAGWWSWGNECIKFNAEQYWRPVRAPGRLTV